MALLESKVADLCPRVRMLEMKMCSSVVLWQDFENGEECEKMISRKDKSLGLLCRKFLARYPDYPRSALKDICLDDVATELSMGFTF